MIFSDCVRVNEIIYAFSEKKNLFLKFSMNNNNASIIGSIPTEAIDSRRLVSKLLFFEDQILMVPSDASNIWIYTLKTQEWILIDFEEPNLKLKFATGYVYEDKAYMIGCMYAGIAIYDFINKELRYFKNIHTRWKRNQMIDIFCRDYAFIGASKVLIPSCLSNEIAELNMKTMETVIHKVGDAEYKYEAIGFVDGHCWITTRKGDKIIIWDMESEIKVLDMEVNGAKNICHYCGITAYSNKIALFASNNAESYCFDFLGNILKISDNKYLFCHKEKHETIVQTCDEIIWIIEDNAINKIYTRDISIEGLFKGYFYEEDGNYTLGRYIDSILEE